MEVRLRGAHRLWGARRSLAFLSHSRFDGKPISSSVPIQASSESTDIEPNYPSASRESTLGKVAESTPRPLSSSTATATSPSPAPRPFVPPTIRGTEARANLAAHRALAANILRAAKPNPNNAAKAAEALAANAQATSITRQSKRRWRPGDAYAPFDLSSVEAAKWAERQPAGYDIVDALGIKDPVSEWKNVSLLEAFRTSMGMIKGRRENGLRKVNQRKIAKAIRRAIAMGWLPSVHEHPEVMETEARKRNIKMFGMMGTAKKNSSLSKFG